MKENGAGSTDSSVKKRRKTSASSTPTPINTEEVYKKVCSAEEAEASKRDPGKDMKMFYDKCNALRTYMKEIAALKKKGTPESREALREKSIEASLLFVALKKLNRLEKLRTKCARDELHRMKSQVDSQHLQLQNLLYEVLHLQKEVTKCMQFKSQDEQIDLVSLEEFYRNAPESLKQSGATSQDSHQLQKARLEWELQQRKHLAEVCKQMQVDKEKIAQDIEKRQQHLDNLTPMLRNILEATKPVESSLGIKVTETKQQHSMAYLLPQPLFFLYVQADAYREANDPLLSVSISGDIEEARRLKQSIHDSKEDDDSESDQEQENAETKRHHRKRGSKVDRMEERRKQLLTKHPLSVDITVPLKDGSKTCLTFSYLTSLLIVTVKTAVHVTQTITGVFASQMMTPENLLSSLFPGDNGMESPNAANFYQLNSAGLGPFSDLVGTLGFPYAWAQRAAGLDFVDPKTGKSDNVKHLTPSLELNQSSIPSIIHSIQQRFKTRLALCRQIQSLESGTIPSVPSLESQFPSKICAQIDEFIHISWAEYRAFKGTQILIDAEAISENDFFFRMTVARGQAKMKAYIAIKGNYPVSPPLFSLEVIWKGKLSASDSDAVRDMEREVNVFCEELKVGKNWTATLFVAQVKRMLYCFDIYLESEDQKKEFPKENVILQPTKGRTRTRPFKYLNTGGGVFTQR